MNVKEQGPLVVVIQLPTGEACGSLDHATPIEQMQAIDAIMRFYFGLEDWLTVRNKHQPGLNVS